jgi:hypothetical protein
MNRLHYLDLNEPPMDWQDKLVIGASVLTSVICLFIFVWVR